MTLSQNNEVLIYIQEHGSITPLEALEKIGSFRLGARIFELRRMGHNIETEYVETLGKRFARYVWKDAA